MELRSGRLVGVCGHNSTQFPYHPLMNAVILRNVFAHLAISDCKTLRLVNKLWLQELQKRWADETVVKITLTKERGNSDNFELHNSKHKNCKSIDDFLNQSTSPFPEGCLLDGKPVRNLRIRGEFVNEINLGDPSSAMNKFWSIFGPSLQYLDLRKVKFASSIDARKLLFELTPNLETLKFASYGCAVYSTENEPTNFQTPPVPQTNSNLTSVSIEIKDLDFPFSWMTFFAHFPKIQKFTATLVCDSVDINLNTIFDAWITIRKYMGNEVLNLTHLTLYDYTRESWRFDDRLATKLCGLQFPLSQLKFRWLDLDKNVLSKVIETHRGTLNNLAVVRSGRILRNFPYEILPENLTKLKLAGDGFPSWKFLKFTPNLQKLFVATTGVGCGGVFLKSCAEFRRGQIPVLTHLTELYYETMDVVSASTVKFLVTVMLNVTKLELSVDAVGFKHICKSWKLREWSAQSCVVDENVFVKHVTFLSSLSKLEIYKCHWPGFGEMAIHDGFLKLKSLTELVAPFSSQVSANSTLLLRSQVREVYMRRGETEDD